MQFPPVPIEDLGGGHIALRLATVDFKGNVWNHWPAQFLIFCLRLLRVTPVAVVDLDLCTSNDETIVTLGREAIPLYGTARLGCGQKKAPLVASPALVAAGKSFLAAVDAKGRG